MTGDNPKKDRQIQRIRKALDTIRMIQRHDESESLKLTEASYLLRTDMSRRIEKGGN